jgi:hypothetical protein
MAVNPKSLKNLPQYAGKSVAEIERSIGTTVPDIGTAVQGVGPTAEAILAAAEPVAAEHLYNVASGRSKVPPHVRAQVCLEMVGRILKPKQPQQSANQIPEGIAAALAAVGRVLELRKRAAEAETIPAG